LTVLNAVFSPEGDSDSQFLELQ